MTHSSLFLNISRRFDFKFRLRFDIVTDSFSQKLMYMYVCEYYMFNILFLKRLRSICLIYLYIYISMKLTWYCCIDYKKTYIILNDQFLLLYNTFFLWLDCIVESLRFELAIGRHIGRFSRKIRTNWKQLLHDFVKEMCIFHRSVCSFYW